MTVRFGGGKLNIIEQVKDLRLGGIKDSFYRVGVCIQVGNRIALSSSGLIYVVNQSYFCNGFSQEILVVDQFWLNFSLMHSPEL